MTHQEMANMALQALDKTNIPIDQAKLAVDLVNWLTDIQEGDLVVTEKD